MSDDELMELAKRLDDLTLEYVVMELRKMLDAAILAERKACAEIAGTVRTPALSDVHKVQSQLRRDIMSRGD